MNKTMIEDALISMGVPVGNKGFNYIRDAIEILDEKGTNISIIKELYHDIAVRNKTTVQRVERAIRHNLELVRKNEETQDIVKHYIGLINCSNSNSLKQLHLMLKREESNNEN